MAIDATSVINAYRSTAQTIGDAATGAASVDAGAQARRAAGQSFATMLSGMMENAVEAGQQSERLSMEAIAGKADVREVVAAVSNAEVALDTIVNVRDRMMRAYQEIMRMPV